MLKRIRDALCSIRWKFVAAYLLIICVAFYVVSASLIRLIGAYMFDQKVREESRLAQEIAVSCAPAYAARDAETLASELESLSERGDIRVLVTDSWGVVQADSAAQWNGTKLYRREVAAVLSGEAEAHGNYDVPERMTGLISLQALFFGVDASRTTSLYARELTEDGERVGVLVLITRAQDIYENLSAMRRHTLLWVLISALLAAVASMLLTRMFTRPIAALNEGIAKMSRGDFSSRVRVKGHNEFSRLAKAYNMMCERIESLDRSRSQFVSNASHELKTPLSTMKILIETLIYQEPFEPEVTKEFLNDVNKEIDRLASVTNDLLTLVNMDSDAETKAFAPVAFSDLLNETAERLAPLAREKGIELECVVKEPAVAQGDAIKLKQVFYNIVDNAIKYTPRGGRVRAEVGRSGRKAVLRVSDTGIGIPKEDQKHIFDRFYRVDKARSRDTGGTGLGLSIVKQIVMLHGGEVSVSSEEDKGSVFVVELPAV